MRHSATGYLPSNLFQTYLSRIFDFHVVDFLNGSTWSNDNDGKEDGVADLATKSVTTTLTPRPDRHSEGTLETPPWQVLPRRQQLFRRLKNRAVALADLPAAGAVRPNPPIVMPPHLAAVRSRPGVVAAAATTTPTPTTAPCVSFWCCRLVGIIQRVPRSGAARPDDTEEELPPPSRCSDG
jgi:hypothetical protein